MRMFEARLDNARSYCAFAATPQEAAETLKFMVPNANIIYVYNYQTQKLVKVLKYQP